MRTCPKCYRVYPPFVTFCPKCNCKITINNKIKRIKYINGKYVSNRKKVSERHKK